MTYTIQPIIDGDHRPIINIFNYYVEHTFAAFPKNKLPYEAFDMFLQMSKGLPTATLKDDKGNVIGFGMLRVFNPMPTFSHTTEITYFIDPDHTGNGLGRQLLEFLETGGREKGIKTILAEISSLNTGSIHFHQQNGFAECGRFKQVGMKKGQIFDTVWMQKMI